MTETAVGPWEVCPSGSTVAIVEPQVGQNRAPSRTGFLQALQTLAGI